MQKKKKIPLRLRINSPQKAKLHNIVDMALNFSAMMRLLQEGSKEKLKAKVLSVINDVFKAENEYKFNEVHEAFCEWGINNIILAEKRRNGRIIKESAPASYGQIAKIFDVLLAVVVYYSHMPDCDRFRVISGWIHAAVDTKMMKYLKSAYPNSMRLWPETIEQVQREDYLTIQKLVRKFIEENHDGNITPTQFDDIYWEALNRPRI